MKKDLARFHSGADFLFLFHLGKRKENLDVRQNLFQDWNSGIEKFEICFARKQKPLKTVETVKYWHMFCAITTINCGVISILKLR